MMVPSAPDGWVPSMVADPDGPLRMLAPSDCTRAPIANVPGGGGVGAETVMLAVPLLPSLEAVIVAEPAATPVTSPLALTVATLVLLVAQATLLPVSALALASLVVAESC